MSKPRIAVGAMGGTIAMAAEEGADGLEPTFTAEQLIRRVSRLSEFAEISDDTITNVGSASISFNDVIKGIKWARDQVSEGVQGIVFTHGTDTLEETAYLMDLLWPADVPLVLTGAMRSPDDVGPDGPANLLAAVLTAARAELAGLGVLVVINDEIHLASRVRKAHTFAVNAFVSPWTGPVGRIVEGQVEICSYPAAKRQPALTIPKTSPVVGIVQVGIGDTGVTIDALVKAKIDGIVIDGVGAGHVSAPVVAVVQNSLEQGIPVIMCSRTAGGRTGLKTYAYPGAEMDLRKRGVIMAGHLTAAKARILLWVLLGNTSDQTEIAREFELRGF